MAGLALCFAFGLGCSNDSGGGATGGNSSSSSIASGGSSSPVTSGGASSGGSTGSGGNSEPASSSASAGKSGSDSTATGGKSGGSTTATGGKGGGGATSSRSTGEPGGSVSTGGSGQDGGTTAAGGTTKTGGAGGNGGKAGGTAGAAGTGGTSSTGTTPAGGAAGTTGGEIKSPGCGKTSTITDYNKGNPIPISVGGQNRRYILQIPTNYDNNKPYKFILALHARDSNDKTMHDWKYYGLLPLSNNTVIFAAPNGVLNGQPCSGTGVGEGGCGWPSGNIPLMDAVVKAVTENFCVDMSHIFATGWSYGASMSYEIGCQRPLGGPTATANWGVRAIAIYSGAQMSGNCKPSTSNPVAFYESHGTNDNVLGYDGGVNLAKNWATANGCSAFSPARASGSHICTNATGCKAGYDTMFCSFVGGHTPFPDSGSSSNSWGPAEVWKFFSLF